MGNDFEDFDFSGLDDFDFGSPSNNNYSNNDSNSGNNDDLDSFLNIGDSDRFDGKTSDDKAQGANTEARETIHKSLPDGKKLTKKSSLVAIGCGVALIISVVVITNLLAKVSVGKPKSKDVETKVTTTETAKQPKKDSSSNNSNSADVNTEQQIKTIERTIEKTVEVQTDSGWREFNAGAENIVWEQNKLDTTFTITQVKHYVKLLNIGTNSSDCMVKTVLKGVVSGYSGTYEMEIPYDLGMYVEEGSIIDVSIQIGHDQNNNLIVGGIEYK